jgi:hypothetical protein
MQTEPETVRALNRYLLDLYRRWRVVQQHLTDEPEGTERFHQLLEQEDIFCASICALPPHTDLICDVQTLVSATNGLLDVEEADFRDCWLRIAIDDCYNQEASITSNEFWTHNFLGDKADNFVFLQQI